MIKFSVYLSNIRGDPTNYINIVILNLFIHKQDELVEYYKKHPEHDPNNQENAT